MKTFMPIVLALSAAAVLACGAPQTPPPASPADVGGEPDGPPAETAADADADSAGNGASSAGAAPSEVAKAPDGTPAEEDYEWLVGEDGRVYRLLRVPKMEGSYRWWDEDTIVLWRGLRFDVAEEAEDHFLVKVYRSPETEDGETTDYRSFGDPGIDVQEPASPAELVEVDRLAFVPYGEGLPRNGQWRNGFALADFDRDGDLDIVHGPARKGRLVPWIFAFEGEGRWASQSVAGMPPDLRLDYGDVTAADFNRDGRPDLALGVHLRGVVVLVDDGEGGFRRWSEGIPYTELEGPRAQGPGRFTSRAVEAVDWNGDGWMDLIALGEGGRMAVTRSDASYRAGSSDLVLFLNRGDGTWSSVDLAGDGHLRGDSLAIADFDADGRPDAATSWMSTAPPRVVIHNRSDAAGGASAEAGSLPGLGAGTLVPAVAAGDFDEDGRDDLAVTFVRGGRERGHGILLYLSRQEGWERRVVLDLDERRRFGALAVGRLPGDSHLDLVAFDESGTGWVFLGDGTGGLDLESAPEVRSAEPNCAGYSVALADLDGEPGDEIVAGFAGEPGGEMLFGIEGQCVSGGGLASWKAKTK